MSQLVVYLMRGLPSSGKSFTARQLAGTEGVVLETDRFFYTQVGEDPARFDFDESLLPAARDWVFQQFRQALQERRSPVVLDRGNGRNLETRRFAVYAVEQGYQVELREPDSPWWQELRVLLKYKAFLDPSVLDQWSQRLAEKSRTGHRVPAATIRRWMAHWQSDLTVHQILACGGDHS